MFITIVEKNGEKITKKNQDTVFINGTQQERFIKWAWESIPYKEARKRVEKLGYKVWEDDTCGPPKDTDPICRFAIWRRVDQNKRKPELIEFEGMRLRVKIT